MCSTNHPFTSKPAKLYNSNLTLFLFLRQVVLGAHETSMILSQISLSSFSFGLLSIGSLVEVGACLEDICLSYFSDIFRRFVSKYVYAFNIRDYELHGQNLLTVSLLYFGPENITYSCLRGGNGFCWQGFVNNPCRRPASPKRGLPPAFFPPPLFSTRHNGRPSPFVSVQRSRILLYIRWAESSYRQSQISSANSLSWRQHIYSYGHCGLWTLGRCTGYDFSIHSWAIPRTDVLLISASLRTLLPSNK